MFFRIAADLEKDTTVVYVKITFLDRFLDLGA